MEVTRSGSGNTEELDISAKGIAFEAVCALSKQRGTWVFQNDVRGVAKAAKIGAAGSCSGSPAYVLPGPPAVVGL
eukprot:scaffold23275_cov19-Tisochrysis_lutea.AAC.2